MNKDYASIEGHLKRDLLFEPPAGCICPEVSTDSEDQFKLLASNLFT